MHPRPNPMHLSSVMLLRFDVNFVGGILQQRFLVPTASCVSAWLLGTPTYGTSSHIAHEYTTLEIEHADQASFQDLVFVSSQRDANQFPCKHFEKLHDGKISQQASRFARNANHLLDAMFWRRFCNCIVIDRVLHDVRESSPMTGKWNDRKSSESTVLDARASIIKLCSCHRPMASAGKARNIAIYCRVRH